MTPAQCRAARDLLQWSIGDLARAAGVSVITVRKFEGEQAGAAARASIALMRRALEGAGIRFGGHGNGTRLEPRTP